MILDDHARKKMIELAGHRYNEEHDELTVTADRYIFKNFSTAQKKFAKTFQHKVN